MQPKKNGTEIYTIDVETKALKTVISGGVNTYPCFSPDMKKIVFRKIIGDMNSEVFVANNDGTNSRNITNNPAFDGWPALVAGRKMDRTSRPTANQLIKFTSWMRTETM